MPPTRVIDPQAYRLDQPTVISFSGGRSSAMMLHRVLEANGGSLRDDCAVVFANTGKEMPQTLDFVRDCERAWGVPIAWVERRVRPLTDIERAQPGMNPRRMFHYETLVVDHACASRNGEPFESLVKARQYLPNAVARICTVELKIRAIRQYVADRFGQEEAPDRHMIGIRADEQRRAQRMLGKKDDGHWPVLPMYQAGETRHDVAAFWQAQPFDLQLPNDSGTTPLGNCDLCFLKGAPKRISIMRQHPELAGWWVDIEERMGATFAKTDRASYARLQALAMENDEFDFGEDAGDCFCGD